MRLILVDCMNLKHKSPNKIHKLWRKNIVSNDLWKKKLLDVSPNVAQQELEIEPKNETEKKNKNQQPASDQHACNDTATQFYNRLGGFQIKIKRNFSAQ